MHGATVDLDDSALRNLGVFRLEIPVPFVEAGGPANVYLIEDADGRYSIFDTGIGTPDGIAALRAQASERGILLSKLSRIIISHGHVDHFGNAQMLSEESGAKVLIHDADVPKIAGEARFATLLRVHRQYFLVQLGVPVEVLDQMQAVADAAPDRVRHVQRERLAPLHDGEVFHFKHFDAVVRHMPGHTPGLVCLHAEQPKVLFADDHILARISPNPLLDLSQGEGPTKFRALSRYLEGARWVRGLELEAVLPGHGPAFRGHQALLDGLFAFYETRQSKVLARLEQAEASVYDVVPALFHRRDMARLVLMLSEALANIEVLEDQGRVVALLSDTVRYAPLSTT